MYLQKEEKRRSGCNVKCIPKTVVRGMHGARPTSILPGDSCNNNNDISAESNDNYKCPLFTLL